jgi:peptide deformylase
LKEINVERLTIIKYPDPRLRKAAAPIERLDAQVERVARKMLELMRGRRGIGLAGPQVGLPWRLFVCNLTGEPVDDSVFINPRLINLAGEIVAEEGCLSIPDVVVTVRRAAEATLIASDLNGRPIERSGRDLAARCWQHEVDHLDGRLILDRMSESDRIATRRALKQLEAEFKRKRSA